MCVAVYQLYFIILILLFQGIEFFEGGYIGVDIFYVISGYLITSIILRDVFKNFSLIYFLAKGIRRSIPALVFVASFS